MIVTEPMGVVCVAQTNDTDRITQYTDSIVDKLVPYRPQGQIYLHFVGVIRCYAEE